MQDQQLTLLCLSHLRWDHVWQRPQQIMSRFTKNCRVIYVNPPEISDAVTQTQLLELPQDAGVELVHPVFAATQLDTPGHSYKELWLQLLPEVLERAGPHIIMWVYSPLADYLVAAARDQSALAVYDCMDDLASFRDGTTEMRDRETHLLGLADLVFTGGRSMFEARQHRHPRVFCFPSGVDTEHYRQAHDPATPVPSCAAAIPRPRLGYFGVLDERIDWPLIAELAERRPEWHWLLIGPTAKVEDSELPRTANIHYVGQQLYRDLPALLKSFDVATMPFALNEATRYISPTKTLEYLAGGKPVLSSSVPDVVASYTDIVVLADGADAWEAAIEQLLAESLQEQHARLQRARPLLESSTWDYIAARMWDLMAERLPPRVAQP